MPQNKIHIIARMLMLHQTCPNAISTQFWWFIEGEQHRMMRYNAFCYLIQSSFEHFLDSSGWLHSLMVVCSFGCSFDSCFLWGLFIGGNDLCHCYDWAFVLGLLQMEADVHPVTFLGMNIGHYRQWNFSWYDVHRNIRSWKWKYTY